MDIAYFLKLMVEKEGSDLFLTTGAPVNVKIQGHIKPIGNTPLAPGVLQKLIESIMNEEQLKEFEENLEQNLAISVKGVGRFRVNVFRQRGQIGMVIRHIKSQIPNVEDLRLPDQLKQLVLRKRGLILVVGSTGSGKSTTLASMIDHRNRNSAGHILTIEDPIEFLHNHQKSLVNQREVGIDTHCYANALKNAMREAPDVILIGEILDQETMKAAITYAETGHLCLATLHANNADQTLGRIINFFPESAHRQLFMDLSLNLIAIVSQRLVPDKNGGRLPACELLITTPLIKDMIRKGQINDIKDAMDKSLEEGIRTFDSALMQLYMDGLITREEALNNADSKDGLEVKLRMAEGSDTEMPDDIDDDYDPTLFG